MREDFPDLAGPMTKKLIYCLRACYYLEELEVLEFSIVYLNCMSIYRISLRIWMF